MLLKTIKNNFKKHKDKTAFVINGSSYTYADLSSKITAIQQKLEERNISTNDIIVVNVYDDIETYAGIFAIWLSGGTFVPINPLHPDDRNRLILEQVNPACILSSNKKDKNKFDAYKNFIATKDLKNGKQEIILAKTDQEKLMYILFTSGSTGIPKGVTISLRNITSFIVDFNKAGYKLSATDRFLQIYDLTFDASIHCYLLPIFLGASVYTVSPNKIKYLEAYKLMDKYNLSFSKFPPSVLSYLKPYFGKINLPGLKYSLLGGEGLDYELVKEWQKCVPNAQVQNVYGPTEATINTHIFNISDETNIDKTYNGIVAIGKTFGSNTAIIVDKNNKELEINNKGELCLSGEQITNAYWKNEVKNKQSFFTRKKKNKTQRFYKTGDLAYIDDDGDCIFCGRIDYQVQIQGYRIELAEIENVAKKYGKALNYVAISRKNKEGLTEIVLFSEKIETDIATLKHHLKEKLPNYMIPAKIINLSSFPETSSGKIDKVALQKQVLNRK